MTFFPFHRLNSIDSLLHIIDVGHFVTHMLEMLEGVELSLEQIFLVKISNFLTMNFQFNTFACHFLA